MNEQIEVVVVEAGPYISFANCGLPYYVGGEIQQRQDLFVVNPQQFAQRFRIDVRPSTRVTSIDREGRTITLCGPDGNATDLPYDRLVLATGTVGITPRIEGLARPDVFTVRTVPDVDAIVAKLDSLGLPHAQEARESHGSGLRAVIVGGGYIGLETAEQLRRRGLSVTVVEMADQIMLPMDPEMTQPLRKALADAGVEVILRDGLARVEDQDGAGVAITASGRRLPFDVAILAVGVRPNVELAKSAGLALGMTGAVAVDPFQRTSDPNIYAAGDNSEAPHLVLGKPVNIPLAGPANTAGRTAGANAALDLMGADDDDPRRLRFRGVLGTAIVRVCGKSAGSTGLCEKMAVLEKLDYQALYIPGASHAGYYPGAQPLVMKVLFDRSSGRLLGAQAVGAEGVDKRLDVLATAITAGMTIEDLEHLDLCYAPPFGSAKDLQILAGFAGSNIRRGLMPSMTPAELLDALAEGDGLVVLDVRTPREWEQGHLDQALHIPLDDLRGRLDEVPSDKPVAIHCAGGYRSYVAQRILLNSGRSDVRNVLGGFGAIQMVRAARN